MHRQVCSISSRDALVLIFSQVQSRYRKYVLSSASASSPGFSGMCSSSLFISVNSLAARCALSSSSLQMVVRWDFGGMDCLFGLGSVAAAAVPLASFSAVDNWDPIALVGRFPDGCFFDAPGPDFCLAFVDVAIVSLEGKFVVFKLVLPLIFLAAGLGSLCPIAVRIDASSAASWS